MLKVLTCPPLYLDCGASPLSPTHEPTMLRLVEQKEYKASLFMLQVADPSKILSKLVENILQV